MRTVKQREDTVNKRLKELAKSLRSIRLTTTDTRPATCRQLSPRPSLRRTRTALTGAHGFLPRRARYWPTYRKRKNALTSWTIRPVWSATLPHLAPSAWSDGTGKFQRMRRPLTSWRDHPRECSRTRYGTPKNCKSPRRGGLRIGGSAQHDAPSARND